MKVAKAIDLYLDYLFFRCKPNTCNLSDLRTGFLSFSILP